LASLVSYKTQVSQYESNLWSVYIPVPNDIAESFLQSEAKRVICIINKSLRIHCAILPMGNGNHFMLLNKENRKKLMLNIGDEIDIILEPDTSKYGIALPAEMEELLLMDEEGSEVFHKLTPGKQRSLLFIIGKPKSTETRLKKAVVIIDYLKLTGGKLDFKELNEAFKQANSR